jgi:hypothetical protein
VSICSELVRFRGHPEVRATHMTTIELTTRDHLTPRGNCIVGVSANRALAGLAEDFKRALRARVRITFVIEADGVSFSFRAMGDPELKLTSPTDMVIRKSDYICGRTLAIGSEAAAIDIPRGLISSLRKRETEGRLRMEVNGS